MSSRQHWSVIYEDIAQKIKEWGEGYIREHEQKLSSSNAIDIEAVTNDVWTNLAHDLYQKCLNTIEFTQSNDWFEKFKFANQKLDPLHIFASFNATKISQELQYRRITAIYKILGKPVVFGEDDIDYFGCPAPVVIHSLAVRNNGDVQSIWKCFFAAFFFRQNSLNLNKMETVFNNSLRVSGVGIPSLTIFLFWIKPLWFIPLDQNTMDWLKNAKLIDQEPSDFAGYKKILNVDLATEAYIKIAQLAYHKRKQSITATDTFNKELIDYLRSKLSELEFSQIYNGTEVEIDNSAGFQIIALKILPECNTSYSKSLKKDKFFIFNNSFIFSNNNDYISYKPNIISNEFYAGENNNNLSIMINAVVGKNGTGKSTIVEIILEVLNNLNYSIQNINDNLIVEGIHVELFIQANQKIYKFILKGNNFSVLDYTISDSNNSEDKKFTCAGIDNDNECQLTDEHRKVITSSYFLCLNYSQFGFNSSHTGMKWAKCLFHRNDSYQFPILIEPNRHEGNIDIALQAGLTKNRLLTNLFNYNETLDDAAARENFKISEFSYVEKLTFKIDREKLQKYSISNKDDEIYAIKLVDELIDILFPNNSINNEQKPTEEELLILNYTKQYLYKKLSNASFSNNTDELTHICQVLTNDLSFRTRKIWNAINFIRFFNEYMKTIKVNKSVDVLDVSKLMINLKSKYDASDLTYKNYISVEHFIPPSFFHVEIILSNDISFDSLSSGEKQLIFSLNTVLYHLKNLESLSKFNISELNKYHYVNVFFDEIELYFHPELQRRYISDLIYSCVNKLYSNLLWGINFTFITHSPFILSDIHSSQILFLDRDTNNSFPKFVDAKILGANIHDLLINGMFLNNLTGEFIYKKVQEFLNFSNHVLNCTDEQKPELKIKFSEKKEEFQFLAENIGETVIANMIKNNIEMIENKLLNSEMMIKELEEKIKLLKSKLENNNVEG